MAQIYDHRPKTRGAASALVGGGVAGAGVGVQVAQKFVGEQLQQQRYQQDIALANMEIGQRQTMMQEQESARAAHREALRVGTSPDGMYYDNIIRDATPEEDALLRKFLRDPNTPPEYIEKYLTDLGAQQDKREQEARLQAVSLHMEGMIAPPQGGEPLMDQEEAQQLFEAVQNGEMSVGQLEARIADKRSQAGLKAQAGIDQVNAIEGAQEILKQYPVPGPDSNEWSTELRDDIEDVLVELHAGDLMVSEEDEHGESRMVKKDYGALLSRLEYLVRPDMQQAADNRIREKQWIQEGMRDRNPEVYDAMVQESGQGKPPFKLQIDPYEFENKLREVYARGQGTVPMERTAEPVREEESGEPRPIAELAKDEIKPALQKLRQFLDTAEGTSTEVIADLEALALELGIVATAEEIVDAAAAVGSTKVSSVVMSERGKKAMEYGTGPQPTSGGGRGSRYKK